MNVWYPIFTLGVVEVWDFVHHTKFQFQMSGDKSGFLIPISTNVLHSLMINKVPEDIEKCPFCHYRDMRLCS